MAKKDVPVNDVTKPLYIRDRKKDPTVPLNVDAPEGVSDTDDLLHTVADALLHNPSLPIIKRRTIEEKLFKIRDPEGYAKELERRAEEQNPVSVERSDIFVASVQ